MNLRNIAELSALVAVRSGHIIQTAEPFPDEMLTNYLQHARDLDRFWRTGLELASHDNPETPSRNEEIELILSEILVSEILSRVWTAVVCVTESRSNLVCAEPIVRHVHVAMLECRYRALKIVVDGTALPLGILTRVDRLRRKCERWSDLLIGHIGSRYDVFEFAVDIGRAEEFSRDFVSGHRHDVQALWTLVMSSLKQTFPRQEVGPNRQTAHRGILSTILNVFPRSAFDSQGRFKSPLRQQVESFAPSDAGFPNRAGTQAQRMISACIKGNPWNSRKHLD